MMLCEVVDAEGCRMPLVDVDGFRIYDFARNPLEQGERTKVIRTMDVRDDDIYILAPIKSGTHWTWEISSMLLNGEAKTIPKSKTKNMLEHENAQTIQEVASPRLLNSHLPIELLPVDIFKKRCKIVHILRNPKDMLVSWYYHCVGIKGYEYASGTWNSFFELFMKDELEYGSWFDYVKQWRTLCEQNPHYPVHVMYYEDLQQNYKSEIRRLADFLGVDADEALIDAIAEKCKFSNMYKDKMYPDEIRKKAFNGDFTMYRKGVIGDWKTHFTVAQNERMDQRIAEEMKGFDFHFTYS